MNRLGVASRRARVEGGQLGGDEWTRHGSFVNKPTRGWLHSDGVVSTSGVAYSVRVSDHTPAAESEVSPSYRDSRWSVNK